MTTGSITIATMIASDPLAAAIAAAAELAKNGASFMYNNAGNLSLAPAPTPSTEQESTSTFSRPPLSSTKNLERIPNYDSHEEESRSHNEDHSEDHSEEEEDEEETPEDAERRIARSRERNREHARKTRLRKKAQLEALQSKVKGLQAESQVLKQSLEECSIATILVGLSHKNHQDTVLKSLLQSALADSSNQESPEAILQMVGGKRKRFVSMDSTNNTMEAKATTAHPLRIKINGRMTTIGGGRTHINWKTGVYSDENGVQKQLTVEQLESLRRERNRMHAKMTRDRKKNFIATIEKAIDELESKNVRMKEVLSQVVQTHFHQKAPKVPTPQKPRKEHLAPHLISPDYTARVVPSGAVSPLSVARLSVPDDENRRSIKKVCHGFTLTSA